MTFLNRFQFKSNNPEKTKKQNSW